MDHAPVSARPAARVVCLDRDGRVLLLHWYDRVARAEVWEPPGGGIDPGETPLDAARRELTEETGLPGSAVLDLSVEVGRDFRWHGVRYVKDEPFYLARFPGARPEVRPGGLTEEEREAYLGHLWAAEGELPAGVEPPELAEVVRRLTAPALEG
ncbi:NUDIX domain-containing protein [Actinomadura sp. ATCC 31491]|uniref:NUDIX domain-containing protein n=1 Tax=Actinomadura luzonensis TaxID=2805427 RepID=A0ABT0G048_9ACTN|nr:NUDIX domain-containing protein [Actinomadura luzonensis]MCK2217971.1 NUDIX domain-containing protein [Actinomadura luzonensis]